MKKLVVCIVLLMLLFPLGAAQTLETDPNPELELTIDSRFSTWGGISFRVRNSGDAPAHNVSLPEYQINTTGFVIYNGREMGWAYYESVEVIGVLESNDWVKGFHSINFFGFGTFTVTMTVTCDEGVTATGTGNGVVFGTCMFIP